MARQAWNWLSEPLAHDFANTIHWRGTKPVDHIATTAGILGWLAHEPQPVPRPTQVDEATARELRLLRDATRAAMIAVAGGSTPDPKDIAVVNRVARRHATVRLMDPEGLCAVAMEGGPGSHPLLGHLASVVIETLTDPAFRDRLGFCTAPGCGGLFDRERPNQTWCHPNCGARARAERHHRRTTSRVGEASDP